MINKIDHFFGEIFNNLHFWGGQAIDWIMKYISYIAEAGILFLLIGCGLALFKKTRKIGVCILFSVAIGFLITNVILKNVISRSRPFENIGSDFYKWWLEAGANHESGYSFPSGHTTATTAFAVAIFLTTNKKHFWWILTLPLLMACSRIYLMVHYFTDCLGGLIVGSVSAVVAYLIVKWIYSSKFKLFVWARDLDLFNSKSKNAIRDTKEDTPLKPANKDYIYTPQEEENNLNQANEEQNNITHTNSDNSN